MSAPGGSPAPTAPSGLEERLAAERERVEAALERAVEGLAAELPAGLAPVARYGVLSGGKRIRPILCAAAFRASGGEDGEGVYDLAASLELIHAYSLMHDDLPCMDDAELRRGRATTHRVHGEADTMSAGVALIPAAALQAWRSARALGRGVDESAEVVVTLCEAAGAGGMVGGQVLDLEGEGTRLTADELDALHRRKTGALLAAAPRIGALAAGAGARITDAFGRYGRAVGLAFQIADDILDATATAGELGKNPSDAALEKSTYVSVHGLEEARRRADTTSREARDALADAGIDAPLLDRLAEYVVRRRR